jgi:hypothetical protein
MVGFKESGYEIANPALSLPTQISLFIDGARSDEVRVQRRVVYPYQLVKSPQGLGREVPARKTSDHKGRSLFTS